MDLEECDSFATLLKALMVWAGVNRNELAKRVGVRPATISAWTNARCLPQRSHELFPLLGRELGLDVATYNRLVDLAEFPPAVRVRLLAEAAEEASSGAAEAPAAPVTPAQAPPPFAAQYPALALYERYHARLVQTHMQTFVGRQAVMAALQAWAATTPAGYWGLTGAAGLGKTALAAAWARRWGAAFHSFSRAQGLTSVTTGLNYLSAWVSFSVQLEPPRLPETPGEAGWVLGEVLARAAQRRQAYWLIVDALDEADGWVYLPELPAGIYGLVTYRSGYPALGWPGASPATEWELQATSAEQQATLTEYLLQAEALRAFTADPTMTTCPLGLGAWEQQVLAASAGNFMYAHYLVAERTALPAPVRALPQGLAGYYADLWRAFLALRETAPTEWRTVYRPVLGYLVAAGAPVAAAWLAERAGVALIDVEHEALARWRGVLQYDAETARWSLLHDSLREFLAEQAPLLPYAEALVTFYRAHPEEWAAYDGYALRQLPRLLRAAGHTAAARDLLVDAVWYGQHLAYDLALTEYRTQVSAVLAEAQAQGLVGLPDWLRWTLLLGALAQRGVGLPLAGWQALLAVGEHALVWRLLQGLPTLGERIARVRDWVGGARASAFAYTVPEAWVAALETEWRALPTRTGAAVEAAVALAQIGWLWEQPERATGWLAQAAETLLGLPDITERWLAQGALAWGWAQVAAPESARALLAELPPARWAQLPPLAQVTVAGWWWRAWLALGKSAAAETWFTRAVQALRTPWAGAAAAVAAAPCPTSADARVWTEDLGLAGLRVLAELVQLNYQQAQWSGARVDLGDVLEHLEVAATEIVMATHSTAAHRILVELYLALGEPAAARSWLADLTDGNMNSHFARKKLSI